MKTPTAPYLDQYIKPENGIDWSISRLRHSIKRVFLKLDRMLTAMAYAEAGDLDAVKKILDEEKSLVNK